MARGAMLLAMQEQKHMEYLRGMTVLEMLMKRDFANIKNSVTKNSTYSGTGIEVSDFSLL